MKLILIVIFAGGVIADALIGIAVLFGMEPMPRTVGHQISDALLEALALWLVVRSNDL